MLHWRNLLTEQDLAVFEQKNYWKSITPGPNPAILIIDINFHFLGTHPQPILESIVTWPLSCGLDGWNCLPAISKLIQVARSQGLPVIYTTVDPKDPAKQPRGGEMNRVRGKDFPQEIAPASTDLVLLKEKPSAFFGTPLLSYLIRNRIDTVLVTGCATSGCVRATVVDATSYDFNVILVDGTTFDRYQASHAINLFDMHAKYAMIMSLDEALLYLNDPKGFKQG